MKNSPKKYDGDPKEEPRLVEAEIVDEGGDACASGVYSASTSLLRRLLARAALSLFLGALGLALIAVGTILTITIIGAPFGVPLVVIGFLFCLVALLSLFARGQVGFISSGPRR
jgi:hypothetical protein